MPAELFDDDYLYFYDGRLADVHSDREAALVERLLELTPGLDVLDAPCGHGRLAVRLAESGCRVVGLDCNPGFLNRARAEAIDKGVAVEYIRGDLRELPGSERFDCAFNWFTSFGYFDDEGNREVLAGFHRVLRPGGRLLLDLIHRDELLRRFPREPGPLQSVVRRDRDVMVDTVRFDVVSGRSHTERLIVRGGRTRVIEFSVRQPTFPELRQWLLDAGFRSVDAYDQAGEAFDLHARRMIVVARRD